MKIFLLSDTHSYVDPKWLPQIEWCDEIWHAGDVGAMTVLDYLKSFDKTIRGVYGNIDNDQMRKELPLDNIFELEGFKIWMTHIGGYPGRYHSRVRDLMPSIDPNLFICGHSHILKIEEDKKHNLWAINPGAAGAEGFHAIKTALTFELEKARLSNLQLVEYGKRGKI
jgi:hypothetical protein